MAIRTAIYPGTFDPITNGHMDIIRRTLAVVDELVVGVALDTAKTPMFDIDQRAVLVEEDLGQLGPDAKRVRVVSFSGLLVNMAAEQGATLLIRGLRAVSDFEYEFQMAALNRRLDANIETLFIPASESTHFISSRFIKQIARLGGEIDEFVSPHVKVALQQHFTAS